jgi:hypothetical protein
MATGEKPANAFLLVAEKNISGIWGIVNAASPFYPLISHEVPGLRVILRYPE